MKNDDDNFDFDADDLADKAADERARAYARQADVGFRNIIDRGVKRGHKADEIMFGFLLGATQRSQELVGTSQTIAWLNGLIDAVKEDTVN